MATARKTVDDMTFDELKQLINELLDEREPLDADDFDLDDSEFGFDEEPDTRSHEEVFRSMDENRWTPPPGTPSPSQMICEARDS